MAGSLQKACNLKICHEMSLRTSHYYSNITRNSHLILDLTMDKSLLAKGLVLAIPVSLLGLCSSGDDALLIAALLVALQQVYGSRGSAFIL